MPTKLSWSHITELMVLSDEDEINYLTWIMAYDFEITEIDKCIEDILLSYEKERLVNAKNEILACLENKSLTDEERKSLEKELSDIIIKLAKIK